MRIIPAIVICLLSFVASAQKSNTINGIFFADTTGLQSDSTKVTIRNIFITGNKKTREYIIRREIAFTEGSSVEIYNLIPLIERARENIYNTQLFLEVKPQIQNWVDGFVDVYFEVRERWYLFPLPYFKLVDRNLNQWIGEQSASLKRVNYGLKFGWNNVSGR
ncbi:MAG: POTRA domain-containing protein, partial [Sphingobacteriales bacterium]